MQAKVYRIIGGIVRSVPVPKSIKTITGICKECGHTNVVIDNLDVMVTFDRGCDNCGGYDIEWETLQ